MICTFSVQILEQMYKPNLSSDWSFTRWVDTCSWSMSVAVCVLQYNVFRNVYYKYRLYTVWLTSFINMCDLFSLAAQHKIVMKRHKVRQMVPCHTEGGTCEPDSCLFLLFFYRDFPLRRQDHQRLKTKTKFRGLL